MDKRAVTRPRRRAYGRFGNAGEGGRANRIDGGGVGHGGSIRLRLLVFELVESAVATTAGQRSNSQWL